MKHGKKLNVKLIWRWNLNLIPLSKCKLSVHIVRVKLIVRQADAGNASSKRSRTIICRLENWKQKNPILKAARTVNPDGMFVNEDLAAEILQRRKELLPKLKQAKQVGKIAYFVLDKLIIRDRPSD